MDSGACLATIHGVAKSRTRLKRLSMHALTVLLVFYVLVFWPRRMWDLSSLTRNGTHAPHIRR